MVRHGIIAILLALATAGAAPAQGRFAPAIAVGDSVVTGHQIDQRTRFLTLLGAPGDVHMLAREQLINEAVQMRAADAVPPPEVIEAAMAEFAARGNMTPEQFVAALGQAGVGPETFRDFITAGVAWRDHVRARFGDESRTSIPQDQVRRTLAQTGTEGGTRVLISEVILPATTPETTRASRLRAAEIAALPDEAAFAAAARRYSVAPSSGRGGALNWVAVETLPGDVAPVIGALTPGRISRPVELENAIGVFLLRDVERVAPGTPATLSVDYALFVADSPETAARVAARTDTCDDLYGAARGLPAERLVRETRKLGELPADIRAELAGLDDNEISTALTRGGRPALLMLCARTAALESTVDIEIIGTRLVNARLGAAAADYLADLRAATPVRDLAN